MMISVQGLRLPVSQFNVRPATPQELTHYSQFIPRGSMSLPCTHETPHQETQTAQTPNRINYELQSVSRAQADFGVQGFEVSERRNP